MLIRVGLIGLCCWSLSSFAAFPGRAGSFKGGGAWKMTNGATGNWTSQMEVSKDAAGNITVKEALTIHDPNGGQQTESVEWTAKSTGNGFYEILAAGKKTGDGVCFAETCQITMNKAGDDVYGEVFHFDGGKIFRQGYDFSSAEKVAWDGVMAQ